MCKVANSGINIVIRGSVGWERFINNHPRIKIIPDWVVGDDYPRTICATKINLCFLRKANRDLHTTRSIEIPACGGFMLAERTSEHLELFLEGKEADYFSDEEELISKINYYLRNDNLRSMIGKAGRKRCIDGKYSYQERFKSIFHQIIKSG